jgi:hypothetical protein
MRPDPSKELVFHRDFVWFLGAFNATWASLELISSYGIYKFLKITAEETHILTSGMEFGRKLTLLRNLVYRSNDHKKKDIIRLVSKIQNESKRNVFAHSFIISGPDTVTFVERSRGGDYAVTRHTYSLKSWADHCCAVARYASQLEQSLGVDKSELHSFAQAAFKADTKSTKSPDPPHDKA